MDGLAAQRAKFEGEEGITYTLSQEDRATCNLHNVSDRLPAGLLFLSEVGNASIHRVLAGYRKQKWC